jgi:hypothetical protein
MNILFVAADNPGEWNTSQWRCANPADAINKLANTSGSDSGASRAFVVNYHDFMKRTDIVNQCLDICEVIVIERLLVSNTITPVIDLEAQGRVVIADVDDAYNLMPKTVPTHKFWHDGIIKVPDRQGNVREAKMIVSPKDQLEWGMKLVHAVTTPSKVLVKDWLRYRDDVYHAPNYIPTMMYLKHKKFKGRTDDERETKFIIGWGGSWTHIESWKDSGVIDALRDVCKKRKNVVIRIAGGDKRVAEAIDIPARVFPEAFVDYDKWPPVFAGWDLGLVPLAGEYDNRRSWIKSLEYTLMGIPWVGTKAPPTEELADYGTRVKNTSFDWKKAINYAIDNYAEAKARVVSGFEFAMAQDVDANVQKILELYQTIYEKVKGS